MDIYGDVWHVQFGRLELNQSKCDSKQEERLYGGSYPYVNGEKMAGRHGHFTVEPLFQSHLKHYQTTTGDIPLIAGGCLDCTAGIQPLGYPGMDRFIRTKHDVILSESQGLLF